MTQGRTIALIGDSGAGKTTQAGEYAKYVRKTRGLNTVLNTSDRGGYDSISPLVRAGVVIPNELGQDDDPWIWINNAVKGVSVPEKTGCVVFDSGTSISDVLLTACHKSEFQIGQQRTQKFTVSRGQESLAVSINNEAHYGVVQQFMLEMIRNSTWLTKRGIDVIWSFALFRGEAQDRSLILGPKVAGKALTAFLPKEFNYMFRLQSIPVEGDHPRHVLYTSEHPELAGLGHSFGNARLPLGANLPAIIEPASLSGVFAQIEQAQKEADEALALELGL